MTPAATSALAAIVTFGSVGLVAHTIRMVKVATLAMLKPKQSTLGTNLRPALRFFWNMVMCVAPMARKHAMNTAHMGISTPREGMPPNTAGRTPIVDMAKLYYVEMNAEIKVINQVTRL